MDHAKVAIVGFGTIGSGVARLLLEDADRVSRHAGKRVELVRVVDTDLTRPRNVTLPTGTLTDDLSEVTGDPEIVAVVRYDRERDTNRAEYAALVEDRFQGIGLGFGLTCALIGAARTRGIRDFEALVLPENKSMIRLLHSLDFPERVRWEDGIKHFSIDLFPEEAAVSGGR